MVESSTCQSSFVIALKFLVTTAFSFLTLHFHVTCSKQWSNASPNRWKDGAQFVEELLTDKERRRFAQEHWDLHHGFDLDMPEISGHQNADRQFTNPNLTMMPPRFESLMEYWDNETVNHDNLKNLSELLDSSF